MKLNKATQRFITICRDHASDKIKTEAVSYAKAVEAEISTLEMEILSRDTAIRELHAAIQLHVDVMRAYGIDTGRLGGKSIYSILGDVQMAEQYGHINIPEKLTNYVKP